MIRFFLAIFLVIGLYLLIVLIGLIPVNNDFQPDPDGIEIFLISTAVHADIVLPIKTATIDWREQFPAKHFSGDTSKATHAAIGWGDRGFYIGTPTWGDLKFSTAAKALFWPSDTCMHVALRTTDELPDDARSVKISVAQYEKLVEHIKTSFRKNDDGTNIRIADAAYDTDDAFFEATGTYHSFNTCNCWAGRATRSAGIKTGWFTPMPGTVFLYLPD